MTEATGNPISERLIGKLEPIERRLRPNGVLETDPNLAKHCEYKIRVTILSAQIALVRNEKYIV